jgi:hypothetical protein
LVQRLDAALLSDLQLLPCHGRHKSNLCHGTLFPTTVVEAGRCQG